jgi:Flp pilus assembly protein TadB
VTLLGALTGALVLAGAAAGHPYGRARWAPGGSPIRRTARVARPEPASTLPDLVDLLAIGAAAGLPVGAAIGAATPWAPEPWRAALVACARARADGSLLRDAVAHVHAVDPVAGPLVAVLRAAISDGDGLTSGLARLAADARDLRQRRAEERARALPVRLLLPLVGCSLPAFVVLTIVPILAGALPGLRLPTAP